VTTAIVTAVPVGIVLVAIVLVAPTSPAVKAVVPMAAPVLKQQCPPWQMLELW
jgi:hypothetical protein